MHLKDLTWPAVADLQKDMPVVLPVAALEQHGHHLPLFTDSLLLGEIVNRVAERFRDRVLFAPLMWLGNSDHHMDYAGTMSAAPRLYLDLLLGLAENFLSHGFSRIVFLNGHGGNDVPGRQAIFELRQRYRHRSDLLLLFATYWSVRDEPVEGTTQVQMGHACEWETSMMLRIAPHLVGNYRDLPAASGQMNFSPVPQGWITKDRTVMGHIGDPQKASAEKGEILFARFSADVGEFLDRVTGWTGPGTDRD